MLLVTATLVRRVGRSLKSNIAAISAEAVYRSWALGGYHPIDDPPFNQIALAVALAFWHVFAEHELVDQLVGRRSSLSLFRSITTSL